MPETPEAVALSLWSEMRNKTGTTRPESIEDELRLYARCMDAVRGRREFSPGTKIAPVNLTR